MSDTSEIAMMTPEANTEALPMTPEVPLRRTELAPVSAIRKRRGDRPQIEVARAAGISQAFLSELEGGRKRLTPGTAQKLAPVLGIEPKQLMVAERGVNLERVARMVRVDPQPLLAAAQRLIDMLPPGKTGDDIIDVIAGIAQREDAGDHAAGPALLDGREGA